DGGVQAGTRGQQQGSDATEAGEHRVLYIDWSSFDPNVSLFGTVNPAVCLPPEQREEDNGQAGCTAWQPRLDQPSRTAAVLSRDGWKMLAAFDSRPTATPPGVNSHP